MLLLTLLIDLILLPITLLIVPFVTLILASLTPGQLNALFLGWCRLLGIQVFKTTVHQRSSRPADETATRPFREDHVYAEVAAERRDLDKLKQTAHDAGVFVGAGRRPHWFEPLGTTRLYVYYLRIANQRKEE